MSSGTMLESRAPSHPGRELIALSAAGCVAVRNGRVVIVRWTDVPRTAMDAVAAIAGLRDATEPPTI
jgi:hypothetical protein